ncbi:molybdopterin oxidoreductase family protein [Thermovibrio sp.]
MIRSVCTYCGVGCEIGWNGKEVVPVKEGVVSKGKLCIKGKFGYQFLNSPERIRGALVKGELLKKHGYELSGFPSWGKGFFKVPYSVAFSITAKELLRVKENFGGKAIGLIGGARTNCESAYLFQKFGREVLGTPNVDNCARICHAPSLKGLRETVGEGAASVPFDEIYNAEFIFVIGSNTTEAHPIVSHRIIEKARKGTPLAVIDVREIGLFKFSTYPVVVPYESNLLFLNALARVIVEGEFYDKEFVKERVLNFDEFKRAILKDPLSKPEVFEKLVGYEGVKEKIYSIAIEISQKRTLFLWGLGITEHTDGSRAVMAIANLALLTGNLGKRGAGLMPLRGQNNVQGACDVGMLPYYLPDYKVPEEIGLTTPEMIDSALKGGIRALWIMGEDIAHVHPNLNKIKRALEGLDFLAVNELFPCRITEFAHVVFGVKSCYEKVGVYINAERRLHLSTPLIESSLPDDWEVVAEVSRRMGKDFGFKTTEDVWNSLRKEAPNRFKDASYGLLKENFNNSPQWPVVNGKGTEILYKESFPTKEGKAKLVYSPYRLRGMVKELMEKGDFEGFYLTTGRNLVHYNNANQTNRCQTLKKFKTFQEDLLYMNRQDWEELGRPKAVVLESNYGKTSSLTVEPTLHLRRKTLFATFHHSKSLLNCLFGDEADEFVKTARFKSVKVKVLIPKEE